MDSTRKIIASLLLGLTALLIGVGTTGLHIHHEDHSATGPAHAASPEAATDDHCATHCEGEPLLEHFLENHGSLFNKGAAKIRLPGPVTALLAADFSIEVPAQFFFEKTSETCGNIHTSGPLSERAPPFSA